MYVIGFEKVERALVSREDRTAPGWHAGEVVDVIAQASTRQLRLGVLRDAQRGDVDGLRTWLRRAGEEILLIRSLQAAADRAG